MSRSPVTREFATFGVRLIPLACLASLSVFLCRPAFEGLGRGRPGLLIALLRYALLTGPMGWIGIRLGAALGYPGLYGLLLGLIGAAGISSAVFLLWTRRVLRALPPRPPASPVLAPSEL